MPGILRFFLSILVVFSHLSGAHSANHFGYFAVRAFFVLSGLILTKSLHETYSFEFYRFYVNRLLRIVPLYAMVCAITIAVIIALPQQASEFMPRWAFREDPQEILQNFLLLPLASGELHLRFIEPAWSLAVELVMYYFLWLGMARSQKLAMLCLGFGAAYHIVLLINGASFNDRYFSVASAFLSYALGVMVYFHYDWLASRARLGAACAILWFVNMVFGALIWGDRVLDAAFYLNTLLFALAAPWMLELRLPKGMRPHEAILGHLSYPVFLVQWLGGFVGFLLLSHFEGRGVALFYVSLPFIVAMAVPLWMLNELLIEPARKKIRQPEQGGRGLSRSAKAMLEPAE